MYLVFDLRKPKPGTRGCLLDEKFTESLVKMLMGLDKLEVHFQVLFLVELIKEMDDRGFLVIPDKRELLMGRMGIKGDYFDKTLSRLMVGGHVRREGPILYFAPKYMAVKTCDGNLVISAKKSEKSLGEVK